MHLQHCEGRAVRYGDTAVLVRNVADVVDRKQRLLCG
jgi:hypothetical protein